MFLKKIDFLSPPISLYYRGFPSHSSSVSGILTIIGFALILSFSIYQLTHLFNRDKEIPKFTTFTYFIEDAGTITLDTSSLFHFLSLEDFNNKGVEGFDFSYFNVIGIDNYITNYEIDKNITHYNHWLYWFCNENDIKGIENITTHEFLTESACIKKYFDSKIQKYYDKSDPNFKWPSLSHGTFHPGNTIYSIIVKSCEKYILNNIFNNNLNYNDINELDFSSKAIHLNFIEQYIDVSKYKNPIGKYFFRIENKFDKDNYSVNHLNFNPSIIKSNNGYIFEDVVSKNSFFFDKDDVFTYERKEEIFMAYSFYLNNRIRFYERTYQTVQEVLSIIGGISNFITIIFTIINDFINSYFILIDFNYLLGLFSITIDDIDLANRKNIINIKLKQIAKIKKIVMFSQNQVRLKK